ncbi:MAG: PIN domain-containing protein [Lachnospiraceae bacterium]|jgi:predicted nucleic acid-binding protein|nr:PIN domain-containing protein [Lachnospiraceae bacterium]
MTDYNKVFIDTAPFIYYIEGSVGNPDYADKAKDFFKSSYKGDIRMITSVITVAEYKVFPYRTGQHEYIVSFERLMNVLDINIVSIDKTIADKVARIRAEYKAFKAMDALQLATACITGCDLFLTNDKQLRQFGEIKCITVEELE